MSAHEAILATAAKSVRLHKIDSAPEAPDDLGLYNFGNPQSCPSKAPGATPDARILTGPNRASKAMISFFEDLPGFLTPCVLEVMPIRKIEKLGLSLIAQDRAESVIMHQISHPHKAYVFRSWLVADERRPDLRRAIEDKIEFFEKNRERFEDLVLE